MKSMSSASNCSKANCWIHFQCLLVSAFVLYDVEYANKTDNKLDMHAWLAVTSTKWAGLSRLDFLNNLVRMKVFNWAAEPVMLWYLRAYHFRIQIRSCFSVNCYEIRSESGDTSILCSHKPYVPIHWWSPIMIRRAVGSFVIRFIRCSMLQLPSKFVNSMKIVTWNSAGNKIKTKR